MFNGDEVKKKPESDGFTSRFDFRIYLNCKKELV